MSRFDSPDDYIHVLSSDDAEVFELACSELGNKHARDILEQVAHSACTSADIAKRLGLSVQSVTLHLDTLEKIGLIEGNKAESSGDRGRLPRYYRISKFAVLLIPSQIERDHGKHLMSSIMKNKALNLLKKRLVISVLAGVFTAATVSGYLLFSTHFGHLYFTTSSLSANSITAFVGVISAAVGVVAFFVVLRFARRLIH